VAVRGRYCHAKTYHLLQHPFCAWSHLQATPLTARRLPPNPQPPKPANPASQTPSIALTPNPPTQPKAGSTLYVSVKEGFDARDPIKLTVRLPGDGLRRVAARGAGPGAWVGGWWGAGAGGDGGDGGLDSNQLAA